MAPEKRNSKSNLFFFKMCSFLNHIYSNKWVPCTNIHINTPEDLQNHCHQRVVKQKIVKLGEDLMQILDFLPSLSLSSFFLSVFFPPSLTSFLPSFISLLSSLWFSSAQCHILLFMRVLRFTLLVIFKYTLENY